MIINYIPLKILDYQLIPTRSGKHLILWRGYTYSETTGIYYCSKRRSNCNARVKLIDGTLYPLVESHSHDPPKERNHVFEFRLRSNNV